MEIKELNNNQIVVGLDIGTTKVSIIVGLKNKFNKIEILSTGKAPSNGVSRGIVANIDKTVESIKIALDQAQSKIDFEIKIFIIIRKYQYQVTNLILCEVNWVNINYFVIPEIQFITRRT